MERANISIGTFNDAVCGWSLFYRRSLIRIQYVFCVNVSSMEIMTAIYSDSHIPNANLHSIASLMVYYLHKFVASLLLFPPSASHLSHFVLTLSERQINSEKFHWGCWVRGPLPHWWASYVISVFQPLIARRWWIVHSEHNLAHSCFGRGWYSSELTV